MISYCGIPLTALYPEQIADSAALLDLSWICEFAERSWPGLNLETMGFRGALPRQPVKLGSLYWPAGASRFALGRFAADEAQLAAVRAALGQSQTGAGPLVFADGAAAATAEAMSMLPARPLQRVAGAPGLYCLTLVDDRFFWWFRGAVIDMVPGTTTWEDLYGLLEEALGVVVAVDPIAAAYELPAGDFASVYAALPVLLDAAAFTVGQRIVRRLDGTVLALGATSGRAAFAGNLALARRLQGDVFDLTPGSGADADRALPSAVVVTFPEVDGVLGPLQSDYPVTVPNLGGGGGVGFDGVKILRCTAVAEMQPPGGTCGACPTAGAENFRFTFPPTGDACADAYAGDFVLLPAGACTWADLDGTWSLAFDGAAWTLRTLDATFLYSAFAAAFDCVLGGLIEFASTTCDGGGGPTPLLLSGAAPAPAPAGEPTNLDELQAIAEQAATDWYLWNTSGIDATYSGAVNWLMSGVEELVEFQATADRVAVRVQSGPWLDHIDRLLIYGGFGASSGPTYISQTVNNYNATINYDPKTVINYYGPTVNFVQNTVFNVNVGVALLVSGGGSFGVNVPMEQCGWLYWCQLTINLTKVSVGIDYEPLFLTYNGTLIGSIAGQDLGNPIAPVNPGAVAIRLVSDDDITIGGIAQVNDLFDAAGQVLAFFNDSDNTIIFLDEDQGSPVSTRIHCPGGGDFTLGPAAGVIAYHDQVGNRWHLFSGGSGGGAGGGCTNGFTGQLTVVVSVTCVNNALNVVTQLWTFAQGCLVGVSNGPVLRTGGQ